MLNQPRQAVGFLRGRQEHSDLRYWLALVSYDPEEKTVSNKIYLVYLVIFFTIWLFLMLVYIAQAFLGLFRLTEPMPASTISSLLLIITFASFGLYLIIKSAWRSPLIFTEEHRYLLCQQPVPPRTIVFRWWQQPWLQNLLLFILICLMLGFALGEASFPSEEMSSHFFIYVWYGLRVALLAIPFHLTIFITSWSAGLFALENRGKFLAYLPSLLLVLLAISALALFILPTFFGELPAILLTPFGILSSLLLSFFGEGSFTFIQTFLLGLSLMGLSFLLLWLASKRFSPSKAAQETEIAAKISSFMKYGQTAAIKDVRKKQRLGLAGRSRFLPNWQAEKAFFWKGILQYRRNFGLREIWLLFVSLLFVTSINLGGNNPAGWIGLISWLWLLSGHLTELLSQDLSLWQLTRQLPIPAAKWALASLLTPLFPVLLAAMVGQVFSLAIFSVAEWALLFTIPLGLLSAALQLGQDLVRKNRPERLAAGTVQSSGLRGLVMAILCLLLPQVALKIPLPSVNWIIGIITAILFLLGSYYGFLRQIKNLTVEDKASYTSIFSA
ncbi:MAG: putative ABC exporter domain-containing protein [Anaerolineaceae bacterium]|nr:putative ABC exporter domain-containing protein [Anaerolineaceae bacterium]